MLVLANLNNSISNTAHGSTFELSVSEDTAISIVLPLERKVSS